MLNGKTGRKMKKKRTKFLRSTAQPEFNETLTFDLLHNQLDTVQFLIVLCSKVNEQLRLRKTLKDEEKLNKSVKLRNLLQCLSRIYATIRLLWRKSRGCADHGEYELRWERELDQESERLALCLCRYKLKESFAYFQMNVEEAGNTDHPSDSEDSVNSYRRSKDVFIGKVALGKGVRGSEERLHWFSVFQNPRKLVTIWHTLKWRSCTWDKWNKCAINAWKPRSIRILYTRQDKTTKIHV